MRVPKEPEVFRQNFVKKLNDKLGDELMSRNMEKGIFNYAISESKSKKIIRKWENPQFSLIYVDKARSIYLNLNDDIINQIKSKTIKAQEVAGMTHQELCPERWEQLINEKIQRDKYKYETTIEAATDTFTCKKCKSKKCTYYQMQTRSADEPMTTFVTCIDCGNRWKC
jgi:transcription elongation factor S-II